MRTIDITDLESLLPDGWLDKANRLKNQLEACNPKDRSDFLKNNPIWQELLLTLKGVSRNKCWYSEAQEVMSDMDVDHFRPKNEALQKDGNNKIVSRDGYWWLAYNWKNYRLSSIYSNRLRKDKHTDNKDAFGKGAYFPLRNGCSPATCEDKLDDEVIYLLDPINPNDPDLLFFDEEGKAIPAVSQIDEPWNFARAKVSIDIYHLNHTPLKEARQVVWNLCQRKIDEIKNINRKSIRTVTDDTTVERLRIELRELISKNSEFSGVALACIQRNKMRMAA